SLLFIPRHLLPLGSLRVGSKALLASLVMALTVLLLRNLNIFSILPVALLVYLVAAALLGTIPREDLLAIYSAIRHKAQQASHLSIEQVTELSKVDTIPILSIERHKVHRVSPNLSVVEQVTEPELP